MFTLMFSKLTLTSVNVSTVLFCCLLFVMRSSDESFAPNGAALPRKELRRHLIPWRGEEATKLLYALDTEFNNMKSTNSDLKNNTMRYNVHPGKQLNMMSMLHFALRVCC